MKTSKNKKGRIIRAKLSDPIEITEEALRRLDAIRDEDIDFSDIPMMDEEFFKNAQVVKFIPKPKKAISIRLDQEIYDWFKSQGKGYQTLMNAVLHAYYQAHQKKPKSRK